MLWKILQNNFCFSVRIFIAHSCVKKKAERSAGSVLSFPASGPYLETFFEAQKWWVTDSKVMGFPIISLFQLSLAIPDIIFYPDTLLILFNHFYILNICLDAYCIRRINIYFNHSLRLILGWPYTEDNTILYGIEWCPLADELSGHQTRKPFIEQVCSYIQYKGKTRKKNLRQGEFKYKFEKQKLRENFLFNTMIVVANRKGRCDAFWLLRLYNLIPRKTGIVSGLQMSCYLLGKL